ncbi:hypothetical protein [Kribbella sp.]|uniref:hypothetical protein n=1 Tax=Kribbella sp. TaxID=1871183 RepID=UPI002D665D60|nr:hypothetical protein [Kribbella sp.]HZX06366.1 hypothetical protein [Kribbella sp.]
MSLLFDAQEIRNFRDKVPKEDFGWLPDLIAQGSNLAGPMAESQNANRLHLGFLRSLELFGTEVPQGLDGLRQFATTLIDTYEGADGDSAARVNAINLSFHDVEGKPLPEPAPTYPVLPTPPAA